MESQLNEEVSAFLAAESILRKENGEPWVVFASQRLQGRFPSYETAYEFAASKYESGQFLIRSLDDETLYAPLMFVSEG